MKPAQAKKMFLEAFKEVRRFGVKVAARSEWGTLKNGEFHLDKYDNSREVCACGALVLALNPKSRKRKFTGESVIQGTMEILKCTKSQAYAVSEGFEGHDFGDQYLDEHEPEDRRWYQIGKSLRRHADRIEENSW